MNAIQLRRTGGLFITIVALVAYSVFAYNTDAQDAQTGTPSPATVQVAPCEAANAQVAQSSAASTPTGAELQPQGIASESSAGEGPVMRGSWMLPAGASLQIEGGTEALIKIDAGIIALQICGGDGVYDTKQADGQTSVLVEGGVETFTSSDWVFLDLKNSAGTFRITGTSLDKDAQVSIEVANPTAESVFCDGSQCWGSSDATPVIENASTPEGGCGGVACWVK